MRRKLFILFLQFFLFLNLCAQAEAIESPSWTPACDNLKIDPVKFEQARAAGHRLDDYRFGRPSVSGPLYINQILLPESPGFNINVPAAPSLYGSEAGNEIPYTMLVCYPSAIDNPSPDYVFPESGVVIPAMRQAGGDYIFYKSRKFPLVIISHGLLMDPLDKRVFDLVQEGYVVAAVFHGDGRFPFPSLINLSKIEQFSLRPLSISAAIDYMLQTHPARKIIDATRIGGVGVSIGGLAMFSLTGAQIIGPDHFSIRHTAMDPRISAVAGIVPYMGTRGIPFPILGVGARGASHSNIPYMAVSSAADPVADIQAVQRALNQKPGDAFIVSLESKEHYISDPAIDLSFDWILPFLETYLKGKPDYQDLLTKGSNIESSVASTLIMANTDQFTYINETFDAIESILPEMFPSAGSTLNLDNIFHRSYPDNRYLAVYANELYLVDSTGAHPLGPVMYWWSELGKQ